MKVVILAGGYGTRISEESDFKPKPMIEIGEKPILWHIMKVYSHYGLNDFIICSGYKQNYIKQWFSDYYINNCDVTFDFSKGNEISIHNKCLEPWKVTVVDTGLDTNTGGRIKRIEKYIDEDTFCLTYGDGVSDINILDLIEFHKKREKSVTLTAIQPEGRFGVLGLEGDYVTEFREKSKNDMGWINAGFMICNTNIFQYIDDDNTIFEHKPLNRLAELNEVIAYKYYGFWKCMDTIRDKRALEKMWKTGQAPWKVWD